MSSSRIDENKAEKRKVHDADKQTQYSFWRTLMQLATLAFAAGAFLVQLFKH